MVNLAGPRPLGNSVESMDLGFALQAHCLEAVARGDVGPESCVVPVPRAIDEAEARRMAWTLARHEGLFAGTSTGLNVVAALQLADTYYSRVWGPHKPDKLPSKPAEGRRD